jgi:hypothetical protein
VALGALAAVAAYGFILWNLAVQGPLCGNPGFAGTFQFILSIVTFWAIAAGAGYFASDGTAVWPALLAGLLVGILAGAGNLATMPVIHSQLVAMYQCPFASDPNGSAPSFADEWNSTLLSTVIGSAIGLVLAPVAAAGGYVIKRDRRVRVARVQERRPPSQ